MLVQLLRDVPFTAIFWSLTEPIRRSLLSHTDAESLRTRDIVVANVSAASIAGIVAAALTTPFDVIKTQQQISPTSRSVWVTVQALVKHRGYGVLFTGVWPRAVRAAPSCAIVVSSYELLKRFLAVDAGAPLLPSCICPATDCIACEDSALSVT